jgi:SAM-dependent methyltransferase
MSFNLDPRAILNHPAIYTNYQKLVGGYNARKRFVEDYVKAKPNDKILDIGCGPGDILDFWPEVDYTGIDLDPSYIKKAQHKYGTRGKFICSGVEDLKLDLDSHFDIVIAAGVIHHLDAGQSKKLFDTAKAVLKADGKFVSLDGCYIPNQNKISEFLLKKDRGEFVRTLPEYETLAKSSFNNVESQIEERYFNIPYTLIIMSCS